MGLNIGLLQSDMMEDQLPAGVGEEARQGLTGVAAGGHARAHFADFFGLQVSAQYTLMGGNYGWEDDIVLPDGQTVTVPVRDQRRFHAVSVPITGLVRIPVTEDYRIVPTGGAGPDFLISAVERHYVDYDEDEGEDILDDDWEEVDGDFGTGLSYTFGLDIETDMEGARGVGSVGFRYTQQFASFGPEEFDDDSQDQVGNFQLMATFTRLF